jgi:hypothetical protein
MRYRSNAYRRAALAEIDAIGKVADPASAAALSAVLKRAALVAYPRSDVARLTGLAWLSFLNRTGATGDFSHGPAAGLAKAAFGAPIGDGDGVLTAARRWVEHHRAEA